MVEPVISFVANKLWDSITNKIEKKEGRLLQHLQNLAEEGEIKKKDIIPLLTDLKDFVKEIKKFPMKEYTALGENKVEGILNFRIPLDTQITTAERKGLKKLAEYYLNLKDFILRRPSLSTLSIMDTIPSVLEFSDKERDIWHDAIKSFKNWASVDYKSRGLGPDERLRSIVGNG
jgi:hypothetical protein